MQMYNSAVTASFFDVVMRFNLITSTLVWIKHIESQFGWEISFVARNCGRRVEVDMEKFNKKGVFVEFN